MTRARVEEVPADQPTARSLLAQAGAHRASANASGVDRESGYGLAYQAALKALVAALLAAGIRVTAGTAGHVVIIERGAATLGLDDDLHHRLDKMRRARHHAFYELEEITIAQFEQALDDTDRVLDAARQVIDG